MAFHSLFLVFLAGLAFFSEAAPPLYPMASKKISTILMQAKNRAKARIPLPEGSFIPAKQATDAEILSSYLKDSADSKHPLIIKILDSVQGSPASNVPVKLYKEGSDGSWDLLNTIQTNANGELRDLITKEKFVAGIYKIELDTATYWKRMGLNPFHHHADVVFPANDAGFRHYTIAVLLSPFSYATTAVVTEPVE
ncbi:transthyretin-like isoform X2 [Heliangelus exortis]|uniref:transthyretin-like isoform X2 n=1 Tax=Heliangelus exortis TaxID=472823 RepID=UPI003A8C8BC9